MIPRKITIEPALNGYLVKVGCQTLVYNSNTDLARDLANYLADPKNTEELFSVRALHKELLNGPCTPDKQCLAQREPEPVPRHDRIADELRAAVRCKPAPPVEGL